MAHGLEPRTSCSDNITELCKLNAIWHHIIFPLITTVTNTIGRQCPLTHSNVITHWVQSITIHYFIVNIPTYCSVQDRFCRVLVFIDWQMLPVYITKLCVYMGMSSYRWWCYGEQMTCHCVASVCNISVRSLVGLIQLYWCLYVALTLFETGVPVACQHERLSLTPRLGSRGSNNTYRRARDSIPGPLVY